MGRAERCNAVFDQFAQMTLESRRELGVAREERVSAYEKALIGEMSLPKSIQRL